MEELSQQRVIAPHFNITAPPSQLAWEERANALAENNLIAFGKIYLPGDFGRSESAQFHYEMAEAYMDDSNRKQLACIIARGHAKSTITKAFILHRFLFHKPDRPPVFIGWVASDLSKSFRNVEYIGNHIQYNKDIIRHFGKRGGSRLTNTWTKQDIMTTTGCALVSRSNVRGIRGETSPTVLGGATRYIYIILDDIENEANIKTFESRDYIKRSVTNAVYPALDEQRGRLIFNGTPIHADSLCQNILDGYRRAREKGVENEYSWRVISYAATQPEMPGGVLWHSYISKTSLEKKRKFYLDTYGTDDGYMQEYELVPYGSDSRIWTSDHYGYHTCNYFWNEEQQQSYLNWHGTIFPVNCFLGSDPATDVDTERTDDSVIMVVAVDKLGRIFVLEYIAKRAIPSISIKDPDTGEIITELGVVDYIFQLYDKYHCLNGTVEDCGMTRGIFNDIQAEKVRLKRFDIIIHGEKPAGREKLGKIKTGLNPSFAQRLIHVRENHYKLREQIEGMGLGLTHEDVLESLFFATRHIVKPTLEKKGQGYVKRAMSQVKSWVVA